MNEMLLLEEERMERMTGSEANLILRNSIASGSLKSVEDERIIRQELNRVDPSAVTFSESWSSKKVDLVLGAKLFLTVMKSRIRHSSPYGHIGTYQTF